MRRGAIGAWVVLSATLALSCTDIPTSDNAILAIQIDQPLSPSLVVGDTLRDTTGKAIPLNATVYNFNGNVVASVPLRFHAVDRGITVDSVTGFAVGDSVRDTPARVVVTVGDLQAIQQLLVVLRPDTAFAVNGRDSLAYSILDSTRNVSPALSMRVRHSLTSADSPVKSYVVSFAITSPTDELLAQLVNDANVASRVDTTDASGEAARKIRLNPARLASLTDSIIVAATVRYRGAHVRGSPVRLVLKVKPGS